MRYNLKDLPIYKKAMEITELVDHIIKAVEQTDIDFIDDVHRNIFDESIDFLRENSLIIPDKIVEVASDEAYYDMRMENATIIRKSARELVLDAGDLHIYGYEDEEYLGLLKTAVEEFRIIFAEWVQSFDPWNYRIDRWGLFNPPGINYDDPNHDDDDDDDDLPFGSDDFFDED